MKQSKQFEVHPEKNTPAAYLQHFSEPVGSPRHHASHYLGGTNHLSLRLAHHRAGRGSAITRAAVKRGSELILVRTWKGGFAKEKELKRGKNHKRLCPLCKGVTDGTDTGNS